jgi:hypothetical protein
VAGRHLELQRRRGTATLRISPFEPLRDAAAAGLTEEAEALLRFVEEDASTSAVEIGA